MASAGLVFLLLMLSSLLVSTVRSSPTADQQEISSEELKKIKIGFKEKSKAILKNIDDIRLAVSPFLTLIPIYGPLISAIFTFTGIGVSVLRKNVLDKPILEDLKTEFESINLKLDQYHVEQKWNTWASGTFYQSELNIKTSWDTYQTLVRSVLLAKDDDERERHKKEFVKAYKSYKDAAKKLNEFLKNDEISFKDHLGNSLAEHVKCHEKNIREYSVLISTLIYKSNTMNQFYNKVKKTESLPNDEEAARIAHEAGSAMFQLHLKCIIDSMVYIEKDVEELIDATKKRKELAGEVRLFLEEAYDKYDWMVVAFISKKSSHNITETMNRHVLTGFTEVKKAGVSVAVARQVKGTHTKGVLVKQAIDKCIDKSVLCHQVAKKLGKCSETVEEGIQVFQIYTAVHAYLRKAHDSHNAQEAPDDDYEVSANPEDSSAQTPYIFTGKCNKSPGVKGGKFVVLIKSDEEMLTKDPCSKLNCGDEKQGKCVRVEDTFRAVCQCNYPYYGHHCEHSVDKYKSDFEKKSKILVVDSRRRNNPRQ